MARLAGVGNFGGAEFTCGIARPSMQRFSAPGALFVVDNDMRDP
jgi:hypothetical protein